MKLLIVVIAVLGCSLAAPEPEPQFFNQGRYNNPYNRYPYNQYNYNQYNPYNQYNNGRYRPQFYSTPAPFASTTFKPFGSPSPASVSVTPSSVGSSAEPQSPPEAALAPVVASVAQSFVDGKAYRVSDDRNAQILRLDNDQTPEGGFQYSYETSNGIAAQALGSPRNFGGSPPNVPTVVQGSFSWVAPEGKVISISYVADENGYRAVGDAIPTPPPIPEAILRSIEYNRQFAGAGNAEPTQ